MTPAAQARPLFARLRQAMRLAPRSLAVRIVTFSTFWAVVTLVVIATLVSTLFRTASERGFDSLLSANMFNLIASVSAGEDGTLTGQPNLGDGRYDDPGSGWYWEVRPARNSTLNGQLRSASFQGDIETAPISVVPFNDRFIRRYDSYGSNGEWVGVLETEFELGGNDRVAAFRVTGNLHDLEAEIADFNRQLYTYLALFGIGMVAINAAAILLGLRPLRRVHEALSSVREGAAKRLDGSFPAEIAPLADETNALIENNRRILERSRTQVGNLAHSLKTPLAVLMNEADAIGGAKGRLVGEQVAAMKQQVDHYLQRARIAAQRESVVFRAPANPVIERMGRVMAKLNPRIDVEIDVPDETVVFAGEREDLEEIAGNLLENAMKWGRSRVLVRLDPMPATTDRFALVIEDDGPGIPEDRAREAMKRGRRLDETKPGTGLGLAIVSDLVAEYGGSLALERSELGGLRAVVELRRVA